MTPVHAERLGIARYQLLRPLGDGGTATVFEALDREYQTHVAIKILRQREGAALYRFKQEFRVLADLSHPNVVRFGEMFEDQGAFYLTMELIEGVDLVSWVRPGHDRGRYNNLTATRTFESPRGSARPAVQHDGASSARDAAGVEDAVGQLDLTRLQIALPQLCSGLVALHGVGLVHRDLKPENILITQDGRLILLDFGLATEWARAATHELVGTTLYMAPEQLTGELLTAAADWYAFGVILYEMLTGQLPHPPEHAHDAAWKREHRPELPAGLESQVPPELCDLCLQLLHPTAEQRPTDADVVERLGLDIEVERGRASFRSRLQYVRDLFSGRRDELTTLREVQRRAQLQDGVTVYHITGESGVGKSALVSHFIAELSATSGIEILSGRCYERESVPYGGVDRVVDDLSRKLRERLRQGDSAVFIPRRAALLGQVFPVLRALEPFSRTSARLSELDPFEARRLAFGALRELLAALSDECMLVVDIDDVQWLDAESAALLKFLITGPEPPHMLLILTDRSSASTGQGHVTSVLSVAPEVVQLHLGPLSPLESEQLARELMNRLGGSNSEPALVALHSGGHPLFIHELVMHGAAHSGPWAPSLERALASRVQALPSPARTLLEVIALCDTPISHDVARHASALAADAYPWALFTLRAENLVAFASLEGDAEVQPYHDRIRELVVDEVRPDNKPQLHERLARALALYAPEEFDALAHHFLHAGVNDQAAGYAREGAQRALGTLAFAQAARLYQLALQVEDRIAVRAELEEGLGRALANAGRGVDAAEAYLRAATSSTGSHALELRRRAGEQLLRSGRVDRGLAVLSDLARVVKLRMPRHSVEHLWSVLRAYARIDVAGLDSARAPSDLERLRLGLCWTLASGLSLIDTQLSAHFLARAAELAVRCGDADRGLRSVATLASVLLQNNLTHTAGVRLLRRAQQLVARAPSAENQAWLALVSGIAAMGEGNFIECEEMCGRAQGAFRDRCTGVAWEVVTSQAFALWAMIFQGKIKQLDERMPAVLTDARARDDRFALATLVLGPLHLFDLARDDPERARAHCQEAIRDWSSDVCIFQRTCALFVDTQVDLYTNRCLEAWNRLSTNWKDFERVSWVRLQKVEFLGLRARAALSCAAEQPSRSKEWISTATTDAATIARETFGYARGTSEFIAASYAVLRKEPQQAQAHLEHGIAAFAQDGCVLHASLGRYARAVLASDDAVASETRDALAALGVVNIPRMLRLWLPAVPVG